MATNLWRKWRQWRPGASGLAGATLVNWLGAQFDYMVASSSSPSLQWSKLSHFESRQQEFESSWTRNVSCKFCTIVPRAKVVWWCWCCYSNLAQCLVCLVGRNIFFLFLFFFLLLIPLHPPQRRLLQILDLLQLVQMPPSSTC